MHKPARNLERMYRTYNRAFFDNRLPLDTRVWWNDEINHYGMAQRTSDKETKHSFSDIYINPKRHADGYRKRIETKEKIHFFYNMEQVRMTLLHEMCHISIYPCTNHGRKFQEEMLRIAGRGAFKGIW